MFQRKLLSLLAAGALVFAGALGVGALEVDSGEVYCFTSGDFASEGEPLVGVCITGVPDTGAVRLGQRVLQPGDILTAPQLERLVLHSPKGEADASAEVSYLPIYENRVERERTVTVFLRGREDKAPAAEDLTLETYKNLANEGRLRASDPEGEALTYTLVRSPRRGTVELLADGSFVYTPKKNKLGVDSFTYTATDPGGNVSREATVTVRILKPEPGEPYCDTQDRSCAFEAQWLRQTGLFAGEQIGGCSCFHPDKPVTAGEFLVMVTRLLELEVEELPEYTALAAQAPQWLRPYLAAAVRSGIGADWQRLQQEFDPLAPITGAEAAVALQNALELPTAQVTASGEPTDREALALEAMNRRGLALSAEGILTREEAAILLYQVSRLLPGAPGAEALRQ